MRVSSLLIFSIFTTSGAESGLPAVEHHEPDLQWPLTTSKSSEATEVYIDFLKALDTMQDQFYELWLGTWPSTIDWTGAVMGTYISSALSTISRSTTHETNSNAYLSTENIINKYFSQLTGYYFRENAFAIRLQAYDDMLWVVLGWLEGIKFMNMRNELHKAASSTVNELSDYWHGMQFSRAFAHRTRIFYDVTSDAWDTKLCNGGLTWNPSLNPYKNTITNTLFISASIGMYLYHPGDHNRCPFTLDLHANDRNCNDGDDDDDDDDNLPFTKPHDPLYLRHAINGYNWLIDVNLRNHDGLYVDGYHVRNFDTNGTTCDDRNEMVYTYNQGVVLSGLRSLWEATQNTTYLHDGHTLISNVIRATGWDPSRTPPFTDRTRGTLGAAGILTERCDPSASCSQDSQTFKGIFFQHLAQFCTPLPTRRAAVPGVSFVATPALAARHRRACVGYVGWVRRNARAALATRDERGVFGAWWGAREGWEGGLLEELPARAVDYRNEGFVAEAEGGVKEGRDLNDRGRGRTVETHGGGVAVLRALAELLALSDDD